MKEDVATASVRTGFPMAEIEPLGGGIRFIFVKQGTVLAVLDHRDLGVLGVIGRNNPGYTVLDIRTVVIGGAHETVQTGEELIGVEGDRAADMDQIVLRPAQAFFSHQLFLVQLLSRP